MNTYAAPIKISRTYRERNDPQDLTTRAGHWPRQLLSPV